ncbi:MAG: AMP-binding protein [Alphaproteobacteria bacterium]
MPGVQSGETNVASLYEQRAVDPNKWNTSLFDALAARAREHGGRIAVQDQEQELTYKRLVLGSLVLGRKISLLSAPQDRIGVLLPNVGAVAVTMFGLLANRRVPAMLNYTIGAAGLIAALESVECRLVVTSRRFVEAAKLEGRIEAISKIAKIVFLEDIRNEIGLTDRLRGLVQSRRPPQTAGQVGGRPDDIAVILFTSGTERQPKGVALTHKNLLSNIEQIDAAIRFEPTDVVLNPLPVFHAFGLTAGLLLPIMIGVRSVLYPSPLHYDEIPKTARRSNATILIGIDTFAAAWARASGPGDFEKLRLMVLGAEKVKDLTRRIWAQRCGIDILEGYGVTEASPVVAANRPGANRPGTVGCPLPGIDIRLVPVEGITEGEKLLVRGPNVMAGYYFHERPGVLVPPTDGWHDTGDIVTIDDDGMIAIVGRVKRFAKIAGEMVSLSMVESLVSEARPEGNHAVVAVPDPRKGEALVVVSTQADLNLDEIRVVARSSGVSELAVPSRVLNIVELPLLGNGKTDYVSLERLAAAEHAG